LRHCQGKSKVNAVEWLVQVAPTKDVCKQDYIQGVKAFEKVSKGAAIIAHKLVLAQQEIAELRAANEAVSRRKLHKRKQVNLVQKGTVQ
jgi:hypothetical protein